jgi:hypothetical protein
MAVLVEGGAVELTVSYVAEAGLDIPRLGLEMFWQYVKDPAAQDHMAAPRIVDQLMQWLAKWLPAVRAVIMSCVTKWTWGHPCFAVPLVPSFMMFWIHSTPPAALLLPMPIVFACTCCVEHEFACCSEVLGALVPLTAFPAPVKQSLLYLLSRMLPKAPLSPSLISLSTCGPLCV